jgi:hypothetical protein
MRRSITPCTTHAFAYAFASDPHNHALIPKSLHRPQRRSTATMTGTSIASTVPAPNATSEDTPVHGPVPRALFTSPKSPLLAHLRLDRTLISLNLYPRTSDDIALNSLIHASASSASFESSTLGALLGTTPVLLALPATLSRFLQTISLAQLHVSILEILTLIAEDEDPAGLAAMGEELEPSVARDLAAYMTARALPDAPAKPAAVVKAVETLLRCCYLTPWKIHVPCLHVPPTGLAEALTPAGACGADKKQWRHEVDPAVAAHWTVHLGWPAARAALVGRLKLSGRVAATALLDAHVSGSVEPAWGAADAVVAAARRRLHDDGRVLDSSKENDKEQGAAGNGSCIHVGRWHGRHVGQINKAPDKDPGVKCDNLFATLPAELVEMTLAPLILLAAMTSPAPPASPHCAVPTTASGSVQCMSWSWSWSWDGNNR